MYADEDLFNTVIKITDTANRAGHRTPPQWNTSLEAKLSILPHLPKMKLRVVGSLFKHGDATDDELEDRLAMSHQSLSACRRGCVKDGLVIPTGCKRPTRTGRKANIWCLTTHGKNVWLHLDEADAHR